MKKNRLVNILFALTVSASCLGCDSNETSTGYDGREFDISVNQDNSVKASIKKAGTNLDNFRYLGLDNYNRLILQLSFSQTYYRFCVLYVETIDFISFKNNLK